jgi:cell pole-organizing protein PopZ
MEEILASIRRIISEDEPAAEAAPAAAPEPIALEPMAAEAMPTVEAEEVLELTDPLPEPEPERVETHGDLEVHEAEAVLEVEPEPEPMPEPVMAADVYDEPLVSNPTADQTATSFGHLARSVAMPKGGRNLEDVVAELLRPLLKAWLDEHLPTIVQAKVEEEVERIARRRVS